MRFVKIVSLLMMSLLGWTVLAQQCNFTTDAVQREFQELTRNCESIGRNQVCYGNDNIQAIESFGVEDFDFDESGDIEDLADIFSIVLQPLTPQNSQWATALMMAQANLPDSLPGQNIAFILFGDVELLPEGRNENNIQVFRISTGIGRTVCTEVNLDGVFIQTASTIDTQTIIINDAEVVLQSQAFVRSSSDEEALFEITMMNGHAWTSGSDIGTGEQLTVYPEGADKFLESAYYTDPYIQSMSQYITEVYGHCTILNASNPEIGVRVGPGENRTVLRYLPIGEDVAFQVIGKNTQDGNLWWRINPVSHSDFSRVTNQLWVQHQPNFQMYGDCANIPDDDGTAIVPIRVTQTEASIAPAAETTEEVFYAQIGEFSADDYDLHYDISLDTYACTTLRWREVFGGYGAELYLQNDMTEEYWGVTALNGEGFQDICLSETSYILLVLYAPNAVNGPWLSQSITIYVNE